MQVTNRRQILRTCAKSDSRPIYSAFLLKGSQLINLNFHLKFLLFRVLIIPNQQ